MEPNYNLIREKREWIQYTAMPFLTSLETLAILTSEKVLRYDPRSWSHEE